MKPPFADAREKIAAALRAGHLAPEAPIDANLPALDTVCGWDSQDWVELMLWSDELSAELTTVRQTISDVVDRRGGL